MTVTSILACLDPVIFTTVYLDVLNSMSHMCSHCCYLFRSSCRICCCVVLLTMILYTAESSAKKRTCEIILSGRSLMKTMMRRGRRTEPRGTPYMTGTSSDVSPLTRTDWR